MKTSEAHLGPSVRRFAVFLLLLLFLPTTNTSRLHAQMAGAGAVPDFHTQDAVTAGRVLSAEQQQGLANFQSAYGQQAVLRLDDFAGSVDALWDFKTPSYSGGPEAAALAFISEQRALFGISDLSTLRLRKAQASSGGYLVRYDQVYEGLRVLGGGIGVVLNSSKQVIAAFGPYYAVSGVSTSPQTSSADAVTRARGDLATFYAAIPPETEQKVAPALELIEGQLGPLKQPSPKLTIFPTADSFRLAWDFFVYSRHPFGVFRYRLDANSGEVLSRQNMVRTFQGTSNVLNATGDIFPTHPGIDKGLQENGVIPKDPFTGSPLGQLRVNLRNFDATNTTSGTAGELTGTHAHVHNALAVKAPFLQPPMTTWHFARDAQPLEQATREDFHFGPNAEPAEHQDETNIFFFINYLLEYVTHLHIGGDGGNAFPDDFPNKDAPLQGIVHLPDVLEIFDPTHPDFLEQQLGFDNAFSLTIATEIEGQPVVVNPTAYGHGYLFNDLAMEDIVPYHEGMHSISTPIAGFEEGLEAGALNEGQADLWAATISGDPSLGEYIVNGFRLRKAIREGTLFTAANGNPDLVAWIRNANSGLLYSQLCRFNRVTRAADGRECEVHQDGEIYEAAMWDLRELLLLYETAPGAVRPNLITGVTDVPIPQGQDTWEKLFLQSLYILGLAEPDTFVRARDAAIIADSQLFPSGQLENGASIGKHRTLIEHVFAAREIGIHAGPPVNAGRETVSSAVSAFTASAPALRKPGGVKATVFGDGVQVTWKPVSGALAYDVVKRQKGQRSGRLYPSDLATHAYVEGDTETDGFGHVDFVPGSQTGHVDRGQIVGFMAPRGLQNPRDFQYGVRTLNLNPDGTMGRSETEFVDATAPEQFQVVTENFSGLVPLGAAGITRVAGQDLNGITYVDVEFTAMEGAVGVNGALSADVSALVLPDIDFFLFEVQPDGSRVQLASSGNFGPDEFVSAQVVPGRKYIYRVLGFANAATTFHIKSDQFILLPQ
jgi:hypothetical protein